MFGNKHMMVAMIVAPILAIISYFATDYVVSDGPVVAEKGESYALVARSNCRYQSGQCTLHNGDLELKLRLISDPQGRHALEARSNQRLEGVQLALGAGKVSETPTSLFKIDQDGKRWSLQLPEKPASDTELRLATLADGTTFYASTETTFFDYDTAFPRSEW